MLVQNAATANLFLQNLEFVLNFRTASHILDEQKEKIPPKNIFLKYILDLYSRQRFSIEL